ncbi:MAG: potassium-transporting ATPase subunit KdpC [Gemmatimonadaceae bacterium]|nr:potassium-transporting ATPase subunit KdpC [Gemmatimonadaceae bacterium]
MREQLRPAVVLLALMTLVTGAIYPALVTGIARLAFPWQATGSVLTVGGRAVGSALLGQPFSGDRHLIGRPSATGPVPYNGASSSGSNLGPVNPALDSLVRARVALVRAREGLAPDARIPADLVTASGSGLDPHLSPAAAALQAPRIARARGIPVDSVLGILRRAEAPRWLGLVGERRVTVLRANLLLDGTVVQTSP